MADNKIPADQIRQQVMQTLMAHFAREKETLDEVIRRLAKMADLLKV